MNKRGFEAAMDVALTVGRQRDELLAALKQLRAVVIYNDDMDRDQQAEYGAALDAADAAIAKVEGRS